MNATIRRVLTANAWTKKLYCAARESYQIGRVSRRAGRCFANCDELKEVLRKKNGSAPIDLRTTDGLRITVRQNYGDVMTVAEIFLDDCYVRGFGLTLPPDPVVVDIGGFIGDFSLYAVKRLGARRVIVCEPSPRNWVLLLKNIASNAYEDRIKPVNKAVTDGRDVKMNIDVPDEYQCMVSAYGQNEQSLSVVPGISLAELLREQKIGKVDLLKIDCEGGEYAILASTASEVFQRISNIVFEYHDVEDGWKKLDSAKRRLRDEGYVLRVGRGLVAASRH